MDKQILKEIRELKSAIAQLIGTADLAVKDRFSLEALSQAAKIFRKLSIERSEWVSDCDISKIIRGAHYRAGKLIITEFGFKNYFKRGHTCYFYRKDLIALNKELKKRNIDLNRYGELREDQAKFQKYIASTPRSKEKGRKAKPFTLPPGLKDINTSPITKPPADLVRADLQNLKDEFLQGKLGEYIDIYGDSHAMLKTMYYFEKYLDPQIKKRCKKWCENFNYANHALSQITGKKEKFVPVPEEDMIQL